MPYDAFCGVSEPVEEERRGGEKVERVRVEELRKALDGEGGAVVIDTRQEVEYGICALPDSKSRSPLDN